MKIDATDPRDPDWKKFLFPCDCYDSEWVYIHWFDEEEPWDGYLEIVPAIWAPSLWERLKAVAKIIAGQPHYHGGILLNPQTAGELLDLLAEKREGKVNEDGKAESTNEDEDEHIHEDADS